MGDRRDTQYIIMLRLVCFLGLLLSLMISVRSAPQRDIPASSTEHITQSQLRNVYEKMLEDPALNEETRPKVREIIERQNKIQRREV